MMKEQGSDIRDSGSPVVGKFMYLFRALRLVWSATKLWTGAWFVMLVIQGLLPAATVYLTKILVDAVATVLGTGFSWENAEPLLVPSALIGIAILSGHLLQALTVWIRSAQAEILQDHVKGRIHEQAAAVDLEFYDLPAYYDHLEQANGQSDTRMTSILENIGGLVQHTLTLVAIAAILLPYAFWLPAVLLISTLPALWVVVGHNKLYYNWWKKTTEKRRWTAYYDTVLTSRHNAPEIRIFGLNRYFRDLYNYLRKHLRESRLRLVRNQSLANLAASALAFVVTGLTMVWMVFRAMTGTATLGDLALFYQAFNQGQTLMRTALNNVGQLYADTLFLEHLFTFLEIDPQIRVSSTNGKRLPVAPTRSIDIRDLSFKYPGSDEFALRNLTMTIPAGKLVAIVGPNGAGKSTLIKLLCRFYDPTSGTIEWDGQDIKSFPVSELWRQVTVLFQTFTNYAGTVSENIAIAEPDTQVDPHLLEAAAFAGGVHQMVTQLPNGFDTMLGKQFNGGVDLSVGQWQRLALARAFYRRAPIVLLDEPTSFMDSWNEGSWLDRFRKLIEGRTAVIVTHRFTTALRADLIYVMENGRVAEAGSHAELVAQEGLYAASWRSQVQVERRTSNENGLVSDPIQFDSH